ncbi:MAG: T9SS type A sorting domain-containing protein [Bacteroidota bacterium]|nr:T9SS type A sorting domain-containing protein [Bacteroidota bacterium]
MKHSNFFFRKLIFISLLFCNTSYSQLVETFETNPFPPPGWTYERTGSNGATLWLRYTSTGAYGLSNACAVFVFAAAYPVGITQSLVTPSLTPITAGGYIKFDHAYASRFINNYIAHDKFHIEVSSDGGQNYSTLITLNGGDTGSLVTAPRRDGGFIPTSSEWATKRYNLPVGTNKVRLKAESDYGNNLYIDNVRIANLLANDVEAISVDMQRVNPPGSQNPKATFKNPGTATQTFPVTMTIDPGNYISTKIVNSLAFNDSVQVIFDNWSFTTGPYNIKVYSQLATDQDKTNDTLNRQFIPGILWQYNATASVFEFSPDGQYLVSAGGSGCSPFACGQIRFWRVADSTLLQTITNQPMGLLLGYTNDVSFSPDATQVLSAHGSVYCAPNGGCYQDRSGQFIWNFPGASLIAGQGDSLDGIIETIDYSPDGSIFATGRSYNNVGEIRIYNSSGFTLVRTLPGHYLETNKVRFSPDGQLLASVGYDGNLKIWNVSDGMLLRTLFHGTYSNGGSPVSVAFSQSGEFVATSGYGSNTLVKVWRVSDGTLVHSLPGGVAGPDQGAFNNTVLFSPNGTYVAATVSYNFQAGTRGLIRFWNVNTGIVEHEFIDENIGGGSSSSRTVIRSFAFSNSGNLFAYSVGNMIKVTKTDLTLVTLTGLEQISSNVPTSNLLFQNYPNPFNPKTIISYQSSMEVNVSLKVYDVLGNEIATLVNEKHVPGNYSVEFDGTNMSSGIYYYRIEAGNFVQVRKMILIK